jgi:hypothetical protein
MSEAAPAAAKGSAKGPCWRHPDYEALESETSTLLESLNDLDDDQQRFLRFRWRAQLLFFKCRIIKNRRRYYMARGIAVVGAVIVPSLLGADFLDPGTSVVVRSAAFAVSLTVAIATALEEFVGWGKRWRLYRQAHDEMKAEGWRFVQLLEAYSKSRTHSEAFPLFAQQVEEILDRYGEEYVAELLVPQKKVGASGQETA